MYFLTKRGMIFGFYEVFVFLFAMMNVPSRFHYAMYNSWKAKQSVFFFGCCSIPSSFFFLICFSNMDYEQENKRGWAKLNYFKKGKTLSCFNKRKTQAKFWNKKLYLTLKFSSNQLE